MSFLLTGSQEQENALLTLAGHPVEEPRPGFFTGSLSAPGRGAGAGLAQLANQAIQGALSIPGQFGADELNDKEFDQLQKEDQTRSDLAQRKVAQDFRPDPATTGTAGQVLFGATDVLTRYGVGSALGGPVAGAAAVGGSEGLQTAAELRAQGVDDATAKRAGLVSGALSAAGAVLPVSLPGRILTRIGTGAGINTAFGMVDRAAMHKILEAYPNQADQYKALDAQAVAIDAILGAAFGSTGEHFDARRLDQIDLSGALREFGPRQSTVDAALTANNALHVEQTARGVPVTPEAQNAHVAALDAAAGQLLRGDPVDVEPIVRDAQIERPPPEDNVGALHQALDEAGYGEVLREIQEKEAALTERGRTVPEDQLPLEDFQPLPSDSVQPQVRLFSGKDGTFPLVMDEEALQRKNLNAQPVEQAGLEPSITGALAESAKQEAQASFDAAGKFTGDHAFRVVTSRGTTMFKTLDDAKAYAESHGMKQGKTRQLLDLRPQPKEIATESGLADQGQAVKQADTELAEAGNTAKGFQAAVDCAKVNG